MNKIITGYTSIITHMIHGIIDTPVQEYITTRIGGRLGRYLDTMIARQRLSYIPD